MSDVAKAFTTIKAAAKDLTIKGLAEAAGVNPDTAGAMLRKTPKSIDILQRLEAAAIAHLQKEQA